MAEALVSSILGLLTTIAAKEAKQTVRLVTDVEEEVERLGHNLQAIHAVLEDAEEKQIPDGSIKLWMVRLTEAAYDMEDVLDKWNTALQKLQITGDGETCNLKAKVCSCLARCLHKVQVVNRYDIGSEIREISRRLDAIAEEKNRYQLAARPATENIGRGESTSFADVSQLFGREKVKEDIISSLLCGSSEEGSDIKTISVVGMSGVGKTALAQIIYHDGRVEQHFDNRIWVCVTDFIDEKNVAKAIILGLEGVENSRAYDSFQLQHLLKGFADLSKEKGSRILLTTRKETVANLMRKLMKYSHVLPLEKLSDDRCWMILSELALAGRNEKECENLEDVGKKISKRCKGLPLAVKTLGSLLGSKRYGQERENILNSEIWKLDIAEKEIFAPLLLSYYDLPSSIRQCFRYCATFPEGHVYRRDNIIYHWMAQGYLGLDGDQDLELKGREYLDFLAARSLPRFCDAKTCYEIVIEEVKSGSNSMIDLSFKRARHLTALTAEGKCLPTSIYGAEKLRSFVIISEENTVTYEALRTIFKQAKLLRTVDFGWSNIIKDTIPKELGNLIHLRHLNLNGNEKIKRLPESMCELHNLQYLNLNHCILLEKLPDGIGKLINLLYLETYGCNRLRCYPKSAGRLTNLKQLCGISLRVDRNHRKEFSLGDLENLNHLQELWVGLKGRAVNDGEVRRAKFENKTHMKEVLVTSREQTLDTDNIIRLFNPLSGVKLSFLSQIRTSNRYSLPEIGMIFESIL
ncbi:hypothetical protein SLEP1_g25554 [Rubroshorea leprosula]|uniref:Uncharacterized protein n=1 Tax=Rubroshorea leprosula TaxID=152421 RepID=A0AAV5JQH5_9ROSI|nr:hypothetical protein SLEP1_g25554 [Rubroshorea leprosula]